MRTHNIISFLQVFGILLVVIGHSCYGASTPPLWYTWIYSFHMPLFMFISGFLLKHSCERKNISLSDIPLYGYNGFVWKKTKRLIVPYIVISTFAFLPKAFLSQFAMRPIELSLNAYMKMLAYPNENVIIFFWFLPTLYIIFLLVIISAHYLKIFSFKKEYIFILVISFLLYVFNPLKEIDLFNIKGVGFYLFYFLLGYYCCHFHIIDRHISYLLVFILLSFIFSVLSITVIPNFPCKKMLVAINGIIFSILVAKMYCNNHWRCLNHLYGASYAIYLFSWFPQTASQQLFLGIYHAPLQIGSILLW